jgi:predicted NBD/HSP70 family sugar kinase
MMQAANREITKAINQFNVLNTIRKAGLISRIEIAQLTGQSRAAVTNITACLIKEGTILEKHTEPSSLRGRRRVMLALNPCAAYVVGVKLSAFHLSFALTNMQADIISSLTVPVRVGKRSAEFVTDLMEEGIRHCAAKAKLELKKISGIGVGIPGFIDSRKGVTYWSPLYERSHAGLRDLIQDRFKIPTYIENDANTVTLAEQWFGQGMGVDNFLVVTVEHGIGMGIVVNGQIYRGERGIGAEFGHLVIRPGGELCRCGKRGCIESYVADYKVLEAGVKAAQEGRWKCNDLSSLTINDLTDFARRGEPALRDIFKRSGEILGLGISGLIQVFNPKKIIIAGEGVRAGNLLFEPMRRAIKTHTSKELFQSLEIIVEKWQDTDWARGAASLVLQELYKSPFNSLKPII